MAVDPQYKDLPFKEAIAFLRGKVNVPSATWTQLMREAHDWAFTVAGVTKAEMLQEFRTSVDRALSDGTTLQTFRKDFDAIVKKHGWSYHGSRGWRTKTIYRTNLSTSYSAGRYRQQHDPDVLRKRPYLMYRHGDSVNPRPTHQSWDGLVLPADDPWWKKHYPPNGWGCSCSAFSVSAKDAQRRGLKVAAEAPEEPTYEWTDPVSGEVMDIPRGIDPGWDYAPGASLEEDREAILDRTIKRLSEDLQKVVLKEIVRIRASPPPKLDDLPDEET